MRLWAAAGAAIVAAALGAGIALLVAHETGEDAVTATVTEDALPATAAVPTRSVPPSAFDPAALYAARSRGVVTIYANLGAEAELPGLGLRRLDRDGLILTNAHVITNVGRSRAAVRGASAVYVEFSDGDRVRADVVGWDLFDDVGVSGSTRRPRPVARAARQLRAGRRRRAGGRDRQPVRQADVARRRRRLRHAPLDRLADLEIRARRRDPDRRADQPRQLRRAAVRRARPRDRDQRADPQSTSGDSRGRRLRVPIDSARRSLDQLVAHGQVRYAYVGIRTQDVTPWIAREFKLGARRGALVTRVDAGTPAARAGLRGGTRTEVYNGLDVTLGGDVIVAIGKAPVLGTDDVSRIVSTELLPGQTVTLTVLRGGTKRKKVDVTLGERPAGTR